MATGCAGGGTGVPSPARTPDRAETALETLCAVDLTVPERYSVVLTANDQPGVDCVPPDGGEKFSLGFAHAGWWMQLDVSRLSGQQALLALDCWEWTGDIVVDEDAPARWAVRLDVTCVDDAGKRLAGAFRGDR